MSALGQKQTTDLTSRKRECPLYPQKRTTQTGLSESPLVPKADSRTAVIGDAIRLFCQGGRTTAAGPKVAIPARFFIGLGL